MIAAPDLRAYTVEEPVGESVELRPDGVEIERRPVDLTGTEAAFQDHTIEAEEYCQEAVVEEIGLRKTSDTHTEAVSDTVRRPEVEIEKDSVDLDRDTLTGGTRRDDLDRI
ncbi:DUF2382 domain-containing protein [Paracoccus sp. WLY502]|uniref:DUF2382 domain-containing protein n=1 Tax=Paracoccus yibinensis TaxID=3068891 RepID=UPI002796CE14|nr:DUF2382 domain-containing protein [Paracoccus sp. WLY502]MDQ1902658.1 DUF2382 domain-containing protein [Paracoccus sp. WLY502]